MATPEEFVAGAAIRRPRVLWLIKGLDLGGAEQLLLHLAAVRDQEQFDYEAAYVLEGRGGVVPTLEALGVHVHCLNAVGDFDLRWLLGLRRLLITGKYDIVHLHLRYTATLGRLVARSLLGTRRPLVVCTEHNVWGTDSRLTGFTNLLTFPLDDADIAVSHLVRDSLPPWLRKRMSVVVHGLPLESVDKAKAASATVRDEFGIGPDEVLLGTIANLRPQKGYDILLPAARRLVDEGLPVRFLAIGHGPLKAELDELHAQLGLGDRFIFTGLRPDAMRLIAACDVFVLSSYYEGFPVSVMEAMALGLPVVATAVGGIPEAVADGVEGLVIPPGQVDALVDSLRQIVLHPEERVRMGAAARLVGERYDIRTAGVQIEDIYRRLLAAR